MYEYRVDIRNVIYETYYQVYVDKDNLLKLFTHFKWDVYELIEICKVSDIVTFEIDDFVQKNENLNTGITEN